MAGRTIIISNYYKNVYSNIILNVIIAMIFNMFLPQMIFPYMDWSLLLLFFHYY